MPVDILYAPLREEDLAELSLVLLNEAVYEHIGGVPEPDEFMNFLRRSMQGPPPQRSGERWINHVARLSRTGRIIGRLEATIHDGYAEVAYLYGPAHWGNGHATQGLLWLHEQLREPLRGVTEVRTFWATTSPCNTRSASLLRRCGYVPAPTTGVPVLYSFDPGDLVFCRPSEVSREESAGS